MAMTPAIKSTLLSALVFPGGGHFYLRRHFTGILLAGISLLCLFLLFSIAMEAAQVISQKILSGEIPLDVLRIREEVYSQSAAIGSTRGEVATWTLLACWLVGIADTYRLSRHLPSGPSPREVGQKPDQSQTD